LNTIAPSALVGLLGGFASGLLGISPGGILVPIVILLLGSSQHVAQGISLLAQIPPTSLSGIRRYSKSGNRTPVRWLILLAIGFLCGSAGGGLAATRVSDHVLKWTFVGYLTALDALLMVRSSKEQHGTHQEKLPWAGLLAVGAVAGFSSGFMGIGGGLAITAGLAAALKVPQHQAQMASLVLSLLPLTIPAAWIYWRQGWSVPWPVIAAVVAGLWAGADLGARAANRLPASKLRWILIGFVSILAGYMAFKAF
jgi:uncharacterized protein